MGIENLFSKADRAVDAYKKVKDEYGFIKSRYEFYKSPERIYAINKAKRADNVCYGIFILFCILWLCEIVATIVLCVQNNDIILRLLNL